MGALECDGRDEAAADEADDDVCAGVVGDAGFCWAGSGAETETSNRTIAASQVVFNRIEIRGPSFFFWK